jgi:hypothetical protein
VNKIQSEDSALYQFELENMREEWKVTFAEDGKVIEKKGD